MAYNKTNWAYGDIISSPRLNNIETGISDSVIDNHDGTITVNDDTVDVESLLKINLNDYYTKEQVDQQLPLKPGPQGEKGTSIIGISQQYQLSESQTVTPPLSENWSNTILTPTDAEPYLWVKNIFLTNDNSNLTLTYVCPIGKTGPQGKTGQGLNIKGYYTDVAKLPTTNNSDGDCYIIINDLYVYMTNQFNDVGQLTVDTSNFVTISSLNAGLATKEDKLSYTPADDSEVAHLSGANNFDTIPTVNNNTVVTSDTVVGIRNYIATNSWIALGQYGFYTALDGSLKPGGNVDVHSDYISISPQIMLFTWYSLPTGGSATVHTYDATKTWIKSFIMTNAVGSTKIDLPSNTAYIAINVPNPNTRGGQSKLTVGDVKTDWTPAPEDLAYSTDLVSLIKTNGYTEITDGTDLNTLTTDGIYLWDPYSYTVGLTNYYKTNSNERFILHVYNGGKNQIAYPLGGMGDATRAYNSTTSTWGAWGYSTISISGSSLNYSVFNIADSNYGVSGTFTFYNSNASVVTSMITGNLNSFVTSGVFMYTASAYTNSPFTSPASTDSLLVKIWATGTRIVQEASLFSDLSTIKRRSSTDTGGTWTAWA